MKRIALLGSTGSIGVNTLKVAAHLESEIEVVALAAGSNIDILEKQYREFKPQVLAVFDKEKAAELQRRLPEVDVLAGDEGLKAVAMCEAANYVVSAISGTKGLLPTALAIKAKKDIGLANKETLVSGGELIKKLAKENSVNILPIDSEHSAIFQCLQGQEKQAVSKIILTASGGPFREFSKEQLENVTIADALNHPTWNMGKKITIDSSTLMNKGLEVIEAHFLFDVEPENIDVVIHPQSIIHSMVEFVDHSIIAQMGDPNMITPIQYALTYPKRRKGMLKSFDFSKNGTLEFFKPDLDKFLCLKLAFDALKEGGSMPAYMNAANEELVMRFLRSEISWLDIGKKLGNLMESHEKIAVDSIESVLEIDKLARKEANL